MESPELEDIYLNMMESMMTSETSIASQFKNDFLIGDYKSIIESPLWDDVLSKVLVSPTADNLEQRITKSVKQYFSEGNTPSEMQFKFLSLGITCLQAFVQNNWTGPESESYELGWLKKWHQDISDNDFQNEILNCLLLDGESISPGAQNLELLLLARAVLKADFLDNAILYPCSQTWTLLRCLSIHQQILEEPSNILHTEICSLADALLQDKYILENKLLNARLHLECARIYLYYDFVTKSKQEINSAFELLQLEVSFIGALGKRTKFQQKEVAQLTLKVKVGDDVETQRKALKCPHLPKDVHLDDEVRLNQISFSDTDATILPTLTDIQQAAIIALFMHKRKSQPSDNLRVEQLIPYLTCLISQPQLWSLQMCALFYRSKLESNHSRTVERALMQVQALVDSINAKEPCGYIRQVLFHTSYLPPRWDVEAEMANLLISLGAVQSALDIFLRLQLWEEVIACYNYLKLRHKAAEIIRQELDKKETVKMWCLLGDATDDISCYEKAWELSGEKSGRAQRHWALYYFSRKQYAESIPHLEKSLGINSLQVSLWFRLGYAALEEENWELCATAYRRYCLLEPDSFEAWNNLAKAYVKVGNKARAYRALQEAVKCNYENWRVWDNLMAVSTDCADFEEVIRCYHRVLDLKEKHLDVEVLRILTNAIIKDLRDCQDQPASRHRKKALALFGRLTSQVLNDATIWQLYAQLSASTDEHTNESRVKIAQYLQKAHRAATQGNWEREVKSCNNVIDLCNNLAKAYRTCTTQCESSSEAAQFLSSAKLSIKGVLTKIEKEQTDLITKELPESLKDNYKLLQDEYNSIVDEISKLQVSS